MNAFVSINCCQCGVSFGLLPETLRALEQSRATFHCPYGHGQNFTQGPSEVEKLREDLNRLKQQKALWDDERHDMLKRLGQQRRMTAVARNCAKAEGGE